jgi:hypothetical protein
MIELYEASLQRCLQGSVVKAAGNIRIGDHILMVDSNNRVPIDCLLDAATEMYESPEVGILQHGLLSFLLAWSLLTPISFF